MELTIEKTLQQGIAAQKEGKLQEAKHLYKSILQSQPAHPDANHNLGVLAVSLNEVEAALPLFKTALAANPNTEQFWLSYIDALIKEKQFDKAKKAIEQGYEQGLRGEKIDTLKKSLEKSSDDFINKKLNAVNVVEFSFDAKILDEIKKIASSSLQRDDFYCARPNWSSNIQWESCDSFKSFKMFDDVFKMLLANDGMQVAREHIAYEKKIVMYSGFLVIRSECTAPSLHVDWDRESGTNAFTLITPVIQPSDGLNMIFIDNEGFERKYEYEVGKCIAFSSNFLHSTAVGTSSSPSVLLSMTFGTDRMVYWDAISKTAANQGQMYRLPNGCFVHKNFD